MIKIKYKSLLGILLSSVLLVNCSSGGGDDEVVVPKIPEASLLIEPVKDKECNSGTVVSDTETKVTFKWNASKNTDNYTLVLKNLQTNTTKNVDVSGTSKEEVLLRGVPYSWSIISKSNTDKTTATSTVWKFYNAGIAVTNYAPYPAEAVTPLQGALSSSTTTLKWNGGDINNDIESYDVYIGTINPPTVLHSNTTSTSIENVALSSKTVYYWKVVTKDKFGNRSYSPVFDFRTQ
ncbi:hypothetical protein [Flavobacterium ovatum]|uniref:hypothetical protein n=1 Tax=Flavobacterium ovatum TaxID=1928857 RepID=UPI00344EBA02